MKLRIVTDFDKEKRQEIESNVEVSEVNALAFIKHMLNKLDYAKRRETIDHWFVNERPEA